MTGRNIIFRVSSLVLGPVLGIILAAPVSAQTVYVDQGQDWTNSLRNRFYTQDQGSRIMPVAWMRALKTADGAGFLDDALTRYGYLALQGREDADVPLGFTLTGTGPETSIGMTCSACHTRQIDVNGTNYRIDGGPAVVDFQAFLKDLDDAVLATLVDDASFATFATDILGDDAPAAKIAALKVEVEMWSLRFHTLIDRALPDPAWGPSRLDAVSMIFNRLAGLDLGEAPDHLIPENIAVADAPTRYPFLWNAARQDRTQWPGFASNGDAILGLARNLGEVYGVFGEFHPVKKSGYLNRDYITNNSANFEGLKVLEDWIWKIGAPKWPWELDTDLAAQGEQIFNLSTENGGCVECHGIKKGAFRSIFHSTWKTPVVDVGTDRRECQILTRTVKTGVLDGAFVPFSLDKLGPEETAFQVLATSVLGGIVQNFTHGLDEDVAALDDNALMRSADPSGTRGYPAEFEGLSEAFTLPEPEVSDQAALTAGPSCGYEARVLQGIWAAAPYLHNGSVQSLSDLLKPASERAASFKLGGNYDIEAVGLAADQTFFDHTLETTDCSDLDSGNSRCGHEYGTSLSETQKKAILEYLKSI